MRSRHSDSPTPETPALSLAELTTFGDSWLLDGDIQGLSPRTLAERREMLEKLAWFLRQREIPHLDRQACRLFLAYVARAHKSGPRWGNEDDPRCARAPRPATLHSYYRRLHGFCGFVAAETHAAETLMVGLKAPIVRQDQIQPFTIEQVEALVRAAHRSKVDPLRDEALVLFLVGTGARVSEACGLLRRDWDLPGRKVTVLGKGNKRRDLYLGKNVTGSLWDYVRARGRAEEDPIFQAVRGRTPREALTPNGAGQIIRGLGLAAGLSGVRCSPHSLRHTHAVHFLRNGGNVYELMENLGHTSLTVVRRYVKLAEVDLRRAAMRFSPADQVRRR